MAPTGVPRFRTVPHDAAFSLIDRLSPFHAAGPEEPAGLRRDAAAGRAGSIDPRRARLGAQGRVQSPGRALLLVPTADGRLGGALFGLGATDRDTPFLTGKLARLLPAATGTSRRRRSIMGNWRSASPRAYRFERYKTAQAPNRR